MFTAILKAIVETAAVILLLIGYKHEAKIIAFEQRLWKRLRGENLNRPVQKSAHSATYLQAKEAEHRAFAEKERIANNAAFARQQAMQRRSENIQRVA